MLKITHAVAAAADALIAISLAGTLFFDVPTGEARTRVGLYLLLTMAPFSLLAPLIGPMMDRWSGGHRLAILFAAAARAGLAALMSSSQATLLLYPSAFAVLVLSRTHAVGRSSLLPRLVADERSLVAANAALVRAAVLGGASIAVPGLIVQRLAGSSATLVFAAVVYTLAAGSALRIPKPAHLPVRTEESGPASSTLVGRALKVNAVIRATGGYLLVLLAFGLRDRGVGAAGFGLVLAASGLGSFIGATIVPKLKRGSNELWVLAISLLLGGGASLVAAGSFGTDLAAVVGAIVGIMTNSGRLALDSLVQRHTPDAGRGREFAKIETQLQIAWVIGALIPVLIPLGIEQGLVIASAAFLGSAVWYLVSLGPQGRRSLAD